MRIPLSTFVVPGFLLGFALASAGEQKPTPVSPIAQQSNLFGDVRALAEFTALRTEYIETFNRLDPAAMAALYTEDGVVVTPDGWFSGRENIAKWYAYLFQRWRPTNAIRQDDQLTAIGDEVWAIGKWWSNMQSQSGPVLARGFWSAIYVRDGDSWKIRMANYNTAGYIGLSPAANSSADTN